LSRLVCVSVESEVAIVDYVFPIFATVCVFVSFWNDNRRVACA
jgi:hypothetical protein